MSNVFSSDLFQGDHFPKSRANRAELISFLEEKGIQFDPKALTCEEMRWIVESMKTDELPEADRIAARKNITLLRIPPYHPEVCIQGFFKSKFNLFWPGSLSS